MAQPRPEPNDDLDGGLSSNRQGGASSNSILVSVGDLTLLFASRVQDVGR